METTKHGFLWKLAHLSFGKSDENFARDKLVKLGNRSEIAAEKDKQNRREVEGAALRSRKPW